MAEKTGNRVRLSIDVEPELRRRVKIAAARHDQSVREYVEDALRQALDQEPETGETNEPGVRRRLAPEDQERGLKALAELKSLRKEISDKYGPFETPSWVLLNESRDERTRQLMGEP